MIEVVAVLMVIVTAGTIGALFNIPLNPARWRGRTYDPNRPVVRRAGAERVGMTGKFCHFCEAVTFGYSSRCGRCHRLPVHFPAVPTESTVRLTLVEAPPSSPLTAESPSLIAVAATPQPTNVSPSSSSAAGSEVTGVGARTWRRQIS